MGAIAHACTGTQASLHVQFIAHAKSQYFHFLFYYYILLIRRNFSLKDLSLKILLYTAGNLKRN